MHRAKADRAIRTYPAIWAIAILATVTIAAASGSCVFGTATNLCESGRRCDPGQTCAAKQDICVDIDGCGNGRLDPGEACDDGNIIPGDGCSTDCQSNETCGNGITDIGADPNNPKETCDDGNTEPGDGCSDKCLNETCGDGIYDPLNKEECDTAVDTQACNGGGHCTIPRCGDGYTNTAFTPFMATAPEQCDEVEFDMTTDPPTVVKSLDTQFCNGNNNGFEGPGSCRSPTCGDGYTNVAFTPPGDLATTEQCDTGGNSQTCNGNDNENDTGKGRGDCAKPRCGDGYMNPMFTPEGADSPEECDDGNEDISDFCLDGSDGNCRIAKCGDGFKRTVSDPDHPAEDCDDGNQDNTDSCPDGPGGTCKDAFCGDTFVQSGAEDCDTGPTHADTKTCDGMDCTKPACGDGHVNIAAGEICDPGDTSHPCPIGTLCVTTGADACKICR